MEKLKPCPFCGGEPGVFQSVYGLNVACFNNCQVQPQTPEYLTEEAAIQAWNTRAERTCKWVSDVNGIWHGDCGIDWEFPVGSIRDNGVNYCPNCGAKIVEQSEWGSGYEPVSNIPADMDGVFDG